MPRTNIERDLSLAHVEINKLSLSLRTERKLSFKTVFRISMAMIFFISSTYFLEKVAFVLC